MCPVTSTPWKASLGCYTVYDTWPVSMSKDESILYGDEIRWKILHLSLFTMDTLDIADPRSLFMCHI